MGAKLRALVEQHVSTDVLAALAAFSLLAFLLGLALVPIVLVKLPADHFARPDRLVGLPRTASGWLLFALRNVAGVVLILVGVALLFLPGQGLLTMLAGIMLLDLPRKRALVLRLLGGGRTLHAINALRARAGRAPLEIPHRH